MEQYCTYLTTYSGNKLPPFYVGSTSVTRIKEGYRGSVHSKKYKQIWNNELRENPHFFKTKIISLHNTRKEAIIKEEKFHRLLNVVKSSMYINMAIAAPNGFHGRDVSGELNPMYGKKHSEKSKSFMNADKKGKPLSIEHIIKISEYQQTFWANETDAREKLREKFKLRSTGENNSMHGKLGENNPNYGRIASESERIAKSIALSGKVRSESTIKKKAKVYSIEHEQSKIIFTGYGLAPFCRKVGIDNNLLLYHFNHSNKYVNGFKIIERFDKSSNDTQSLSSIIDSILNGEYNGSQLQTQRT